MFLSLSRKHKLYFIYRFSNTKLKPFQILSLGFILKFPASREVSHDEADLC